MIKLLTVFTLLLLGINLSAACDHDAIVKCIRANIDCALAGQCENACGGKPPSCYEAEPVCSHTVSTLSHCTSAYTCPDPSIFRSAIKQICMSTSTADGVPESTLFYEIELLSNDTRNTTSNTSVFELAI